MKTKKTKFSKSIKDNWQSLNKRQQQRIKKEKSKSWQYDIQYCTCNRLQRKKVANVKVRNIEMMKPCLNGCARKVIHGMLPIRISGMVDGACSVQRMKAAWKSWMNSSKLRRERRENVYLNFI